MTRAAGHEFFVDRIEDVTPGMRRVHFSGPEVRDYMEAGPYVPNIKLLFAAPGEKLQMPIRGENGIEWAEGQRAMVRTYTVRSANPAKGHLAVDFVRHGPTGLASSWAENAVEGSSLIALGGGGLVARESDWLVLLGDETALPAIASTIERFKPAQRGVAYVEIANSSERQQIQTPEGFTIEWLERDGKAPGSTTLLQEALEAHEFPQMEWETGEVSIWVSAESEVFKFARRHLRERGFNKKSQLIIGYWHKGLDESSYAGKSDHDRVKDEQQVQIPGQEFSRFKHAH